MTLNPLLFSLSLSFSLIQSSYLQSDLYRFLMQRYKKKKSILNFEFNNYEL